MFRGLGFRGLCGLDSDFGALRPSGCRAWRLEAQSCGLRFEFGARERVASGGQHGILG